MACKYEYDLIVIGLGPAGMAVAVMASNMGLKVAGIEAHKVGGECMNVGCIPSKALLRMGKMRAAFSKLQAYALESIDPPRVHNPFQSIQQALGYISQAKTMNLFDKVDLVLGQGKASFVDPHTVAVGQRRLTARRIFICVGTRPAVPDLPGLDPQRVLTNENLFHLEAMPASLLIVGGGAIAVEMAQAFARLGSRVTMVMRGPSLMWREDADAVALLQQSLTREGIDLRVNRTMTGIRHEANRTVLLTEQDGELEAEQVLMAAGRRMDFQALRLENAKVAWSDKGIQVDRYLRTSARHIYAPGDCNGYAQLSHAAMHQGMLALINAMAPWPFKRDYRNYVVPWTVFTEPAFSWVGPRESQLKQRGVRYETITVRYEDYGAAIAEKLDTGFVKVLVSPAGRIHSAGIVGEGSGESINEWALAIQKRLRMSDIMLVQHSFPTMGFLNKRAAETWMMNRMKSKGLRRLAQWMYRRPSLRG